MGNISTEALRAEQTFDDDLLIDNNFMLLPRGAVLSGELIKELAYWEFETVTTESTVSTASFANTQNVTSPQNSTTQISTSAFDTSESDSNSRTNVNSAENGKQDIKQTFKNITNKIGNTEKARIEVVQDFYNEFINYIETVFTRYATHGQINQTELEYSVKELCVFIKENRRFILRINPTYENTARSYLLNHTMRTTVLSIAIAQQMRMPFSQMTELGVACILHEIGMLQIPPQLYMATRKLTSGEKLTIMKHTVLGCRIVQSLQFPNLVQNAVLDHHEKENGTGYPQRKTGNKISNAAKIISVACSFEAITSPRSYRKERTSFEAMIEMLKNENNQYDATVIKALLYSVSLYPIGAYVYLSNGKVGVVSDVNPDNPKCPIVQMLLEKEKDGSPKTIQTDNEHNKIVRSLSIKEQNDIKKAIEEMEQNSKNKEEEAAKENTTSNTNADSDEKTTSTQKNNETVQAAGKKPNGTEEVDINFFN